MPRKNGRASHPSLVNKPCGSLRLKGLIRFMLMREAFTSFVDDAGPLTVLSRWCHVVESMRLVMICLLWILLSATPQRTACCFDVLQSLRLLAANWGAGERERFICGVARSCTVPDVY